MDKLEEFSNVLTHWSFGITILVGLVASEFSSAETVTAIGLTAFSTFLSGACGTANASQEQFKRKKYSNIIYFLIIWQDILTYLAAASICARLASATIDYISKGHFREFLFGLESHSLGEPWPDVLGVTIVLVVTILFMMGLESSMSISFIIFITLMSSFAFFISIGSIHIVIKFGKLLENFRIHSIKAVLTASAILSFSFSKKYRKSPMGHSLACVGMIFCPLIIYMVTAIIFLLMSHYRELAGTAIPLIRIFESRDVDWARPVMAVCTICVVCLSITTILPIIYKAFVKLASTEWQVLLSSMQYHTSISGAPVLSIFAAGSLTAILAFACPLTHLIKLINTSNLLSCILNSTQLLCNRYKPEIYQNDYLVYRTNVQYSKLRKNVTKLPKPSFSDRLKSIFGIKPTNYISSMNVSRSSTNNLRNKTEERECLLLDDYNTSSPNLALSEDSASENEDVDACSDAEDSGSSTDIDVVVQEYREKLQVATVGKFTDKRPSTCISFSIVIICWLIIISTAICASLFIWKVVFFIWPSIVVSILAMLIVLFMPQNSTDKDKETVLPFCVYPICLMVSIILNIMLLSTVVNDVWQGAVFWFISGLALYSRCCCNCDNVFNFPKNNKIGNLEIVDNLYSYKHNSADTILISR